MSLKAQLKEMIVAGLNLEDTAPEDIEDDAPLFRTGLGLDSLDAVELVMLLKKHYGIELANMEESRPAFQSINALAAFVEARRKP